MIVERLQLDSIENLQGFPPCDPRVRSPRATEDDLVLLVEEVGCKSIFKSAKKEHLDLPSCLGIERTGVAWIQGHGLKTLPLSERGAGPLPDAAYIALAAESVPFRSHRDGVPVLEADVGAV